jgi:hypothetical protein
MRKGQDCDWNHKLRNIGTTERYIHCIYTPCAGAAGR